MQTVPINQKPVIGIIGGTGKEGKGLGYRWSRAGYEVLIGSRQLEKAMLAAQVVSKLSGREVRGVLNEEAAMKSQVAVITVPYAAHQTILTGLKEYLQGKIVIDVTVPLVPPKVTKVQMPPAGSAAREAVQILGDNVQVVSAFQNISYERLLYQEDIDCDVLVCGTGREARSTILEIIKDAGLTGWDAGPIDNSVVIEGLTSILIGINKQYGSETAGIKITGVKRS